MNYHEPKILSMPAIDGPDEIITHEEAVERLLAALRDRTEDDAGELAHYWPLVCGGRVVVHEGAVSVYEEVGVWGE